MHENCFFYAFLGFRLMSATIWCWFVSVQDNKSRPHKNHKNSARLVRWLAGWLVTTYVEHPAQAVFNEGEGSHATPPQRRQLRESPARRILDSFGFSRDEDPLSIPHHLDLARFRTILDRTFRFSPNTWRCHPLVVCGTGWFRSAALCQRTCDSKTQNSWISWKHPGLEMIWVTLVCQLKMKGGLDKLLLACHRQVVDV